MMPKLDKRGWVTIYLYLTSICANADDPSFMRKRNLEGKNSNTAHQTLFIEDSPENPIYSQSLKQGKATSRCRHRNL